MSLFARACTGTPLEAELAPRLEQLRHILQHDLSTYPGETIDSGLARQVMDQVAEFIAWVEGALSEGVG